MQMSSDQDTPSRCSVTYRLHGVSDATAERAARDIAIEQTLEIPHECIPASVSRARIPGEVLSVRPVKEGVFDALISYRTDATAFSVPQFFNMLFGNVSLESNVQVTDLDLPADFTRFFPGPAQGIEGLRRRLGVHTRPLACTAIKPMGLDVRELARMTAAFARGGADIVKDDHGIANQPYHPFRERVRACQAAVNEVNARTGRYTMYCPMISGSFHEIDAQVAYAVEQGVEAVMMAPLLTGLDSVRYVARTHGVVILTHPALAGGLLRGGSHGIDHGVLLGQLFRMLGADGSIFPNYGGRFPFTRAHCRDICARLRAPLHTWRTAFPIPAGGMDLTRIRDMVEDYGNEIILLIGGALLRRRHDLEGAMKGLLDTLREHFGEDLEVPQRPASSCELPSKASVPDRHRKDFLRFDTHGWTGVEAEVYKDEAAEGAPFEGVSRRVLMVGNDVGMAFDVRYFEIEPGGFTSLEKHRHEHVVIGVRGAGVVQKGDARFSLHVQDVVRIRGWELHRLVNTGTEPFGFYCIVDHRRDRPVPVK